MSSASSKPTSASSSSSGKAREQISSFVSGVCARAIEYPFDTIKTRMQAMMKRRSNTSNTTKTATTTTTVSSSSSTPVYHFIREQTKSVKTRLVVSAKTRLAKTMKNYSQAATTATTTGNSKNKLPLFAPVRCCSVSSPSLKTANKILKKEGIRGFYRGSSGPMIAAAAEMSAAFSGYKAGLDFLSFFSVSSSSSIAIINTPNEDDHPSLMKVMFAGGAAGICTSLVITPFELVKCRMQTTTKYNNSLDCLKGIVFKGSSSSSSLSSSPQKTLRRVKNGIKTLYTGLGATLAREIPGNAAWFGCYEFCMRNLFTPQSCSSTHSNTPNNTNNNKKLPWYATPTAGAIAGCFYVIAFYPADTVKTLMQTNRRYSKLSLTEGIKTLYRTSGIRGLYFGVGISAARAIPSNAVIFSIYEYGTASH